MSYDGRQAMTTPYSLVGLLCHSGGECALLRGLRLQVCICWLMMALTQTPRILKTQIVQVTATPSANLLQEKVSH